jgi:hypothetical protein
MSAATAVLRSRGGSRALPWLAGAILVAGIVVFALTFFRNTSSVQPIDRSSGPQVNVAQQKTVPLDPKITSLAKTFIHTAVARQNPALAYRISGPSIRQGSTLAQWTRDWNTVGVPVVPFPVDKVDASPFRIDLSVKHEALLEVALLPKKGTGVEAQVFFIGFKKLGKRWVVDYWGPHTPLPTHDKN